jgi:hypothetical protein
MGNFIWTNHAKDRNKERKISENYINQTLHNPDQRINTQDQKIEYKKRFDHQTVTVIVKQNERGENLILSAWINPPNYGTADYKNNQNYHEMKKASPIKKLWLTLLQQVGI